MRSSGNRAIATTHARASTSPQRRCVMSRTSRSSDSAVPEQSRTNSVGPGRAVPVAQLVDRRRAHHQQVADAEDRRGDGRGGGAPGEDHVVVAGAPGGVAGRGHGLAEPGHEGDEQHRREQRGGVADVGLVVDARRDQPEQRARHGLDARGEHQGGRSGEQVAMAGGPSAQAVQHRGGGYWWVALRRYVRPCERGDHLSGRAAARPAAHRRQPRARHRGARVGRRVGPADPARATGAWTSPAPSTCSRRCSPTTGSASSRGTTAATATRSTPPSTTGRPTSATRSWCSTPSPRDPVVVIGHSKGGSLMLQLADALPHRVSHLINLDGLPSRRSFPDVSDHQRTKLMAKELTGWLDYRRSLDHPPAPPGHDRRAGRAPPAHEPAARARLAALPRHRRRPRGRRRLALEDRPHGALRRLRTVAAGVVDDAAARHRRAGAGRARAPRPIRWGGARPTSDVLSHMPPGGRLELLDDVGHFVHIEQPRRVADLVLEHLGVTTVLLQHNKIQLALHELRGGDGRPLLLLHGLAERTPDDGARPPRGLAGPGVGPRPVRSRRLVGRRRRWLLLRGADGRRRRRHRPPRAS